MKICGFKFDTTYTNLPKVFFSSVKPTKVSFPEVVVINDLLTKDMGLDFSHLNDAELADLFSGSKLPEKATPFAQAYAGHQFGHFTLLGDGRAIVWGEHVDDNNQRFDIQFKGAGQTPYSRRGDGKAALGPMLREYIISEAMHYLGIPTTRSLAVVKTGDPVMREAVFPGAILTRVAQSHIRVGTLQFAAVQEDKEAIKDILNYTVQRHYPELSAHKNKALALIQAVIEKQSSLVVEWMRVGFIHGVMNTDNMLLSGETIDYGPCAFMDVYNPNTVFSSIDHKGRYAYANQPKIAQWNIARLAETLLPLIDEDMHKAADLAEKTVNTFSDIYIRKWLSMMRSKLGLFEEYAEDQQLITDLLKLMQHHELDYTNTFRDLSQASKPQNGVYEQTAFLAWYERWQNRLSKNTQPLQASVELMRRVNPVIIPRNHNVEKALELAHNGDLTYFKRLCSALNTPYALNETAREFMNPPEPSERVYQTFCGT